MFTFLYLQLWSHILQLDEGVPAADLLNAQWVMQLGLLLTVPIFVPVIVSLGYDPVWFGVLFCMNMQVSYLSPPFGPAAFYLKGVAPPEISLQDIFAGLWPFIILQIIGLMLVLCLPEIALWLPRLVYG